MLSTRRLPILVDGAEKRKSLLPVKGWGRSFIYEKTKHIESGLQAMSNNLLDSGGSRGGSRGSP